MNIKKFLLLELLGALLIGVVITKLYLETQILLPWHESRQLLSVIQSVEGILTIICALILSSRDKELQDWELYPIATGLLGMGVLKIFSAVTPSLNQSLCAQSLGGFVGGFCLILIWLPEFKRYLSELKNSIFPLTIILFIVLGFLILFFPEVLPEMVNHGEFKAPYIPTNILTGILLMLPSVPLIIDFYKTQDTNKYLLAIALLLFSLHYFMITTSSLWWAGWWFCNFISLSASVIIGIFTFYHSKQTLSILVSNNEKLMEKLTRSSERISLIIDTSPIPFMSFDSNGLIKDWNALAFKTFGWTYLETTGQKLTDLILPTKLRGVFELSINSYLQTGSSVLFNNKVELTAITREGLEFPVKLTIRPIQLGEEIEFIVFFHDGANATIRKRASDKVIDFYHKINFLDSMVRLYNPDGACSYVSENCYELIGYKPEELIGHYAYEFCYSEDEMKYRNIYSKALNSQEVQKVEYKLKKKNGGSCLMEESLQCLPQKDKLQSKQTLSVSYIIK